MELKVVRKWKKPTYTIGWLLVDGVRLCDTLEDKDRGITQSMPTTEIYKKKVYGQTAIPTGRYKVDMNTVSPKFGSRAWARPYGGIVPWIKDVPGFNRILIHVLNSPAETQGCLGVGWNRVKGKIVESTKAYKMLMEEYLLPAKARNEEIWLTIV